MTIDPKDKLNGLLETAVRGMIEEADSCPVPDDLNENLLRQFNSKNERPSQQFPNKHARSKMIIRYGIAASILAAFVGIASILGSLGGNTLYAQVAERLERLNSLVCRVQWVEESQLESFHGEDGKKVSYLAPSLHRIEDPNGTIHVIDTEQNVSIFLNTKTKEALVSQGQVASSMQALSPIPLVKILREHFRSDRASDEGIHDLGVRIIHDISAIGICSEFNGQVVETWVNPNTHLPLEVRVRLEIPAQLADGKSITMWHVMTDFQYDVEIDKNLMSTKVPEGYTKLILPEIKIDRSPAQLKDLVALLKKCTEHNENQFPSSLSMNDNEGTSMAIMKRYTDQLDKKTASGSDAQKQEAINSVINFGTLLGKGSAFLFSLKPENKLQYFSGAQLNEEDRPLLWYSPSGDANYKVVYADLSVKDLAENELPEKPATPNIEPEQKKASNPQRERWNTPRFTLPRSAVKDFAELQEIRSQGKQSSVQYMVLGWMPEFIESSRDPAGPEVQYVPKGWKPARSPDSARFDFLKEFPNLKGLDLFGLYLTQKDLGAIGQCKNLERLSLIGVHILEEKSRRLSGNDLQKLSDLTNLTDLDLGQLNFQGGLHFLSDLPKLRKLYLGSLEYLNDQSVAELKDLPQLETLILTPIYGTNSEKQVTEKGLRSLQQIPKLKTLHVGWHGKWTMPIKTLQELLPLVEIKPEL